MLYDPAVKQEALTRLNLTRSLARHEVRVLHFGGASFVEDALVGHRRVGVPVAPGRALAMPKAGVPKTMYQCKLELALQCTKIRVLISLGPTTASFSFIVNFLVMFTSRDSNFGCRIKWVDESSWLRVLVNDDYDSLGFYKLYQPIFLICLDFELIIVLGIDSYFLL